MTKIDDHNLGIFFHKLGHFFPIFEKGQGRPPVVHPSSYAPEYPQLIGAKDWSSHLQKTEVHIFKRANLSGFGTWNCTTKEDLNAQKLVFLLNLSLWTTQKQNIWCIFYENNFIQVNSVVFYNSVVLGAFGLKISTFARLPVVILKFS